MRRRRRWRDTVIVHTCAVTAEAERQARQTIRRLRRERPSARIVVTGCGAQVATGRLRRHARDRPSRRQRREAAARDLGACWRPGAAACRSATSWPCARPRILVDGLERPDARVPPGPAGLRPSLHLLHHPLRPRPQPQRAAAGDRRAGAGAAGRRPCRAGGHRGRHRLLRPGPARRALRSAPCSRAARRGARAATAAPVLARSGRPSTPTCGTWSPTSRGCCRTFICRCRPGDDLVLKRMKRRHLRADVVRLTRELRALRPDLVLRRRPDRRLPDRGRGDVRRTRWPWSRRPDLTFLHVFPYSPRPGTPAARMPQVPKAVRKERAARLRAARRGGAGRVPACPGRPAAPGADRARRDRAHRPVRAGADRARLPVPAGGPVAELDGPRRRRTACCWDEPPMAERLGLVRPAQGRAVALLEQPDGERSPASSPSAGSTPRRWRSSRRP